MSSKLYWVPSSQQNEFINRITSGRLIFTHVMFGDQLHLVQTPSWRTGQHTLGPYRPVEPLKSLVFPPRELVGALFAASPPFDMEERIVLGVKNCDLSALRIHDHVLLHTQPVDSHYAQLRKKTILVSCDCMDARETCFCPIVGEQPFPQKGFDLNISPLPAGWVVESGSERGAALLHTAAEGLEAASESALQERAQQRQRVQEKVTAQAAQVGLHPGQDFQTGVRQAEGAEWWKEFAHDCVECGACNFACCTCHCFLLMDGLSTQNQPERLKQWDSCLYRNFARVAGGANPRARRAERLYNRMDKKFVFFPETLGHYACDGCGRCIESCTGRIDIRKMLKQAVS